MLTLYDYMDSGNGYKVRLVLAHLGLPYRLVERDILKGETRTPEFLEKNPNGRIPTLQLADGTFLFESGAIIWYLAEGSKLAPADRKARAETLQWMFFEQYSHEPYIATVRFWKHFLPKLNPLQEMELPGRMEKGYAALGVMEKHLGRHQFFVGGQYGLADIGYVPWILRARSNLGVELEPYAALSAWLERLSERPAVAAELALTAALGR